MSATRWARRSASERAVVNIGQAGKISGLSAKAIRYYEMAGIIAPAERSGGGYRVYGADEVRMLRFVRRARALGFSIERIRRLLDLWRNADRTSAEVKQLALDHVAEIDAKIAELAAMRDAVQELADACEGDHRPDCPILHDLEAPISRSSRKRP